MATETDFVQLWIFLLTICPGLTSAAGAGLQILLVTGISYRYTYTFLKKKALNQKRNDYTRWQCYSKYILKIEGESKSFFIKGRWRCHYQSEQRLTKEIDYTFYLWVDFLYLYCVGLEPVDSVPVRWRVESLNHTVAFF